MGQSLKEAVSIDRSIVQNSVFRGYLFSRTSKNPRKPRNFCPSKISSYTVKPKGGSMEPWETPLDLPLYLHTVYDEKNIFTQDLT